MFAEVPELAAAPRPISQSRTEAQARLDYDTVNQFSRAIVKHLARVIPSRFVAKSGASNRVGKLFVDYLRNGYGATTAAALSCLLEYSRGEGELRCELEDFGGGTRRTLWHNIDRRYTSMGAAGWQICFDVLDHALSDTPLGRIVDPETMKFEGWQRLNSRS